MWRELTRLFTGRTKARTGAERDRVMARPNPARWLWYAYGGRLPNRYREWVRHDNTASTWLLRHVVRVIAEALPVLVIAFIALRLFTHVPAWGVIGVLAMGLLISLFYTVGTARDLALVRLAKHGFPPDVVPPPSRVLPEDAGRRRD
jgi:hypothetical protein